MSFVHFKVDVDSDGLALVTWNSPARSMNVLDAAVIEELSAIVEQVAADAAIKGVVITSGKESFCAGADLTMLESMSRAYAALVKSQGEVGGECAFFRRKPPDIAAVSPHRDLRQAMGRGDQRHRGRRRF